MPFTHRSHPGVDRTDYQGGSRGEASFVTLVRQRVRSFPRISWREPVSPSVLLRAGEPASAN
eukprot:5618363-Prymnesium_polylepis.1